MEFHISISPSNEYSGLIYFRIDWFDVLVVQGTLKSLLQYHSSKLSIPQLSGFFIVQLSHPYMSTGKTIALATPTSVGKVMSLIFNMLPSLVIAFLPRSRSVQFSHLVMFDSLQPHGPQHASITNSRSPPKLMSIESVMPSNYLILCRPLLLLPSVFPSIRVFSNESILHSR